jgi:UDP-N-acetylglucosamine--N-acetylmuramyl-(pentapeptide) pyrophosphoryl-undecaprenol N-acetylglucosamine transferase
MFKDSIFVVAGRTGGPLLPAMAIAKKLTNYEPIIIGVKGGFEEKFAVNERVQLLTLPEAKLTLASFDNLSFVEILVEIVNTIFMVFKLIFSFLKSLYLLLKFKPKAIITAGSFLAVPLGYAAVITNFVRLTNTKIIVHQQDAKISLSNKLIAKVADKITCYFETSVEQFKPKACEVTTNPIDFVRFTDQYSKDTKIDEELKTFLVNNTKPKLLIFGGGSGAFAINKWVFENIEDLKTKFNIIHLTGALQGTSIYTIPKSDNYLPITFLNQEMPIVIKAVDLVICRAGMSSITELVYCHKPAFLVPIPNSHQLSNAQEVSQYFPTLRQVHTFDKPGKENWFATITELYPTYFKTIAYPEQETIKKTFEDYIIELKKLIDKT